MTKTILVVDDSASIRATITMTLQSAGFSVIEADDGNAALSRLDGQRVHLIISDLNMPGMDGMTLLRHLKVQATTRYIPFIMLTTEDSPEIRQQGFDAPPTAILRGEFTVMTVADLQDDLFGLLNFPVALLDLSQLEALDSCGAQLVALLQQEANSLGKRLRIKTGDGSEAELALGQLGLLSSLTRAEGPDGRQ